MRSSGKVTIIRQWRIRTREPTAQQQQLVELNQAYNHQAEYTQWNLYQNFVNSFPTKLPSIFSLIA